MQPGLLGAITPEEQRGLLDPYERPEPSPLSGLLGDPVMQRMQQAEEAQQKRFASGERSPTPLTEDSMWLADDVAGSFVGPMGMAGAVRRAGAAGPAADGLLDMGQTARMARAREQGFDVDRPVYHGTAAPIERFDPEFFGSASGDKTNAIWLTDDSLEALSYGRAASDPRAYFDEQRGAMKGIQAHVEELMHRGKLKDIDLMDEARRLADDVMIDPPQSASEALEILGDDWREYFLSDAKASGFDGVRFLNVADDPGRAGNVSTHVAIFDPTHLRSTQATFDPTRRDSADILAGIGGAGLLGTAMLPDRDE